MCNVIMFTIREQGVGCTCQIFDANQAIGTIMQTKPYQYTWHMWIRRTALVEQKSLSLPDAKVSARQQCVYKGH